MKKTVFFLTLFAISFSVFSQKRKLQALPQSSSIMYEMSHPLHDWDASAKSFKAIIAFDDDSKEVAAAAVVIPIKEFNSGNSNRDSHALEVLEALKYPSVTFTSSDISYDGKEITLNGKLNFHGIEKPLSVKATQEIDKKQLSIQGKFTINMTDFDVKPPGLMGMTTKEEIALSFMFSFEL